LGSHGPITTVGADGSKKTEDKKWLIEDNEQKKLVSMYLNKASSLLDKVYENQKETKRLIFKTTLLIFIAILLIFFLLPLISNNKIVFNFSSMRSLIAPEFLSNSADKITAKDILLVILGGIAAYILVLLIDKLKDPTLAFEVGSVDIGNMGGKKKHKFIHIRIKNYDKRFSFLKFIQLSTLVAFSAKATIIIEDNPSRKFIGRWSNHPQFLPKPFQNLKGNIMIPDINALVHGREDIHPQSRKAKIDADEDKEIVIGLKYEGENEFYIFNNESYIYIGSDYKDSKLQFSNGIYDGELVISTMGLKKNQKFRIYNESSKLEDFRLELIT